MWLTRHGHIAGCTRAPIPPCSARTPSALGVEAEGCAWQRILRGSMLEETNLILNMVVVQVRASACCMQQQQVAMQAL